MKLRKGCSLKPDPTLPAYEISGPAHKMKFCLQTDRQRMMGVIHYGVHQHRLNIQDSDMIPRQHVDKDLREIYL